MVSLKRATSVISKSNLPVADYCANPYVGCTHACKYCYASFMKRFTGEPWGEFKGVYERTRALLLQLKNSGAKISIATKSDLILRDLDLIKKLCPCFVVDKHAEASPKYG